MQIQGYWTEFDCCWFAVWASWCHFGYPFKFKFKRKTYLGIYVNWNLEHYMFRTTRIRFNAVSTRFMMTSEIDWLMKSLKNWKRGKQKSWKRWSAMRWQMESFHAIANLVLKLASPFRELFSYEVDEKRQLLSFVFQNLQMKNISLSLQAYKPKTFLANWRWGESNSRPRQTPY